MNCCNCDREAPTVMATMPQQIEAAKSNGNEASSNGNEANAANSNGNASSAARSAIKWLTNI